jgi:ANTAR domain-containing protein
MSALPLPQSFDRARRHLSEPEAIRTVGRLAVTAVDAYSGLEAIAEAVLRVKGMRKLHITPELPLSAEESFEWSASEGLAPCGSAMASLTANGQTWGRLRIFFEPRVHSVESPLRFARLLAQQSALMLNRLDLLRLRATYLASIERVQERVEMRKTVHRAKGILARSRAISEEEALLSLFRYARETRRPLSQVAEAVILGHKSFPRPSFH